MDNDIDPTGIIGPTQRPGEPSILDLGAGFARGGLYGAAKAGGAQTPEWMDKAASALQNPDLNTAVGMATPVTPPNFAANLKLLLERTDLSQTEIAKILGVGRPTVYRNIRKLGLEGRPPTEPAGQEEVQRLHAEGHSDEEIARRMGIHPKQVWKKRSQQLGLPPNFESGRNENPVATRRWGGTGEGFPIPMSGKKPTLPQSKVPDPQEPGHPWLMRQQGYQVDVRPVEHDPFQPTQQVKSPAQALDNPSGIDLE